jgi:hypothetical protein
MKRFPRRKDTTVKYVIMFTTTPELDADVPPEHAEQATAAPTAGSASTAPS